MVRTVGKKTIMATLILYLRSNWHVLQWLNKFIWYGF